MDGGELYKMGGEPPSLLHPPVGCRFHPRCPFAMDICSKEEPVFEPVVNDQFASCWLYQKSGAQQVAEKQDVHNG
jgi:oligopeptide/dipeptide ABC transporter ATP-binding protein